MAVIDQFNLEGRVAVVTGGAGLLGRGFCQTLAEAGAQVVIIDIKEAETQELVVDLRAAGFQAQAAHGDITDPQTVQALFQSTIDQFNHLDILINSAALDPKFDADHVDEYSASFENFPLEIWRQSLEVDLTGMFLCSQAAARPMLAAGRGVIINLSSIYGLDGPDQRLYQQTGRPPRYKPVTYSVTKAGVLGFTRYLAAYFAGTKIRVNTLTPGGIFNDHDDQFLKSYNARTVLGRMGQVADLQGALLFLASDSSSYMTGANLIIDGGWTAW
jgi:2-deoxy-D-gluconate 3-dehydrogenase